LFKSSGASTKIPEVLSTMDTALEKAQVSQIDDGLNTNRNNDAELNLNDSQELAGDASSNLRLDKHGLPLVPQPTEHKDDPLVSLPLQKNNSPRVSRF